jgi:poly(ADP-ribose) glycohydrolase ARH3
LLYSDDLGRVAEEARLSALPTHIHPIGIEGARMLAIAVALAARGPPLDRKAFYRELAERAQTEEFRWSLAVATRLRRNDGLGVLGNGLEARSSVVTAIACFSQASSSYEDALARAISLGGDTDTLAAMAGALSGAHPGIAAVPGHLFEMLEDDVKGRRYIRELGARLYQRHLSAV